MIIKSTITKYLKFLFKKVIWIQKISAKKETIEYQLTAKLFNRYRQVKCIIINLKIKI